MGPYEILAPIGAGGMGEVHRARDTRLNREVAIKVIPAALAGVEQFRQRFEREAKAISSLNHPHICTLYDVGQIAAEAGAEADSQGQLHYLVMELLDGETLADRLVKGPLPLPDVLKYGRQIALALAAAHQQGITHRDLKPGNIFLTRSGAKLLDFGLAKTAGGEAPPVSSAGPAASTVPTRLSPEASPLTTQGTILGTFQYMAPEQLEGGDAEARTDIFALGAVLYEMATGKRAFQGSTRTSLIAAIVAAQPAPISSLAPMTPPALEHVVRRCLEKDPNERWQSAQDVAAELQWAGEAGSQAGAAASTSLRQTGRERIAWSLAAGLGLAALALAIGLAVRPVPAPARPFLATLLPPPDTALVPFDTLGLSLSPDGRTLAFVAEGADGRKQIWLRDLGELAARAVPETLGASYPFWSPDGRNLGFFQGAQVRVMDLRGGSPRALADAPSGRGGTWGADGTILFAPNITSAIHRVPAAGGTAGPVTRYDPKTEVTHRWPVFLPDGKHFLYLSRGRTEGRLEVGRLMLASFDGGDATLLIDDSTNALYVEPGYLIYGRAASLYAWRFDLKGLRLAGQPVPITREKLSFWEAKNFVPFTAHTSAIVYLPDASRPTQMQWFDRQGRPLSTLGPAAHDITPRISPDGRRIAYMHGESAQSLVDIWVRDVESGRSFRLTQQSGVYSDPAWAPDSDRIAFLCQPRGVQDICVTSVNGGGGIEVLHASDTWNSLGDWMPDGKRLVFARQDPQTDQDIMMLTEDGGEPVEILRTPFAELNPEVSPDGSRLAYTSTQSGRNEVYVRFLQGEPRQWQVSVDGGGHPRWTRGGRELIFAANDGSLMAVSVPEGPEQRPGQAVRLFALPERPTAQTSIFQDVSPDGGTLLLRIPITDRGGIGFSAITSWTGLEGVAVR